MAGVPPLGGDLGSSTSRTMTSSAIDVARMKFDARTYRTASAVRSSLKYFGDNDAGDLYLTATFAIDSFVNASYSVPDGWMSTVYKLWQRLYVTSTIRFDPATGVPTSIEGGVPVGYNVKTMSGLMGPSDTSTALNPSATDNGYSFGNWWKAQPLTWPMWQISGSQFRFFGQNWIRLIKESGP